MTPDVVVRRCTVRVVRHGGWSWGPRPDALLDDVIRSLPALLEQELGRLEPLRVDRLVAAPVRLAIPVRAAELSARGGVALADALRDRLHAAVTAAALGPRPTAAPAVAAPDEPAQVASAGGIRPAAPAPSPLAVLARWLEEGRLDAVLRHLSPAALAAWDRWVFATADAEPGLGEARTEEIAGIVADARARPGRDGGLAQVLRMRLHAAAAARALHAAASEPSALAEIARLLPLDAAAAAGHEAVTRRTPSAPAELPRDGAASRQAASRDAALADRPGRPLPPPRPRREGAVAVAALPFLAVGVLARLGYVAAAAAALAAEELEPRALAQGLAAKLVGPPERGWRVGRRDAETAAALAGLAAPAPPSELLALARAAARLAPVLDGVVAASLLEEQPRRRPLVLHRGPAGELALLDPDGWFLVAASDGVEPLAALAATSSPARVMLTAAADSPDLRRELACCGIDVPRPGRPVRAARVDALLAAFGARPALPRAGERPLERSLELAAALALGTIAHLLWRDDDPDPLLALERLGDLDAQASFEPHRVRVRVPLGRRHRDLETHGLLADVRDLPWLEGRILEFAGG